MILAPEDFSKQPKNSHLIILPKAKNLLAHLDLQKMMIKLLHK
jgi:hypothetical protein